MPPSVESRHKSGSMPEMLGRERHLVGWQGMTMVVPANWNPGKFGGDRKKGDLRLDDEDTARMELRWEASPSTPNVAKSVEDFLKRISKEGKKHGTELKILEDARPVSRNRKEKEQITNFGWIGSPNQAVGCGYGVSWYCETCKRVTFAHVLARGGEKPAKLERLAGEVLTSLECHGDGGWDVWSAFDVKLEIPEEFELTKARLLLNQVELAWARSAPGFTRFKRPERLALRRYPVANVILDRRDLRAWAEENLRWNNKQLALGAPEEAPAGIHTGLLFQGGPRDPRSRLLRGLSDLVRRQKTPPGEVLTWHCAKSNRIWVLESELTADNAHVARDVLESIDCHT